MHGLLDDIGVAVIAATFLGLIAHWLRQPIILGYLIAGAVVGPHMGLGLISDAHNIEMISEIGLVLLLFIIGLEMNLKELLRSGKQLLVAGFGQFLICTALAVLSWSCSSWNCPWPMSRSSFGGWCSTSSRVIRTIMSKTSPF